MQTTVCVVLGIYAALIFAIDQPKVQEMLANTVEEQLGETLHTQVEIGRVELRLFNAVELHDVMLYDQQRQKLLRSQLVFGKIRFTPLLQGKVFLRNIVVLDADICVYQEKANEPTNLQFIIDAFKTEKKEKSRLNLTINSLIFRRCRLAFDRHFAEKKPDGTLDVNHLRISDLDVNLSLKEISPDSLNLRVRNLAFAERSGFAVDELRLHIEANRHEATLRDFLLRTPRSTVRQDALKATYDAKDPATLRRTLRMSGTITDMRIAVSDAAPFVPQLKSLPTTLLVGGHINLEARSLNIRQLTIEDETEQAFRMEADARWDKREEGMAATIEARTLDISPTLLQHLFDSVLKRQIPKPLEALGKIRFCGRGAYQTVGKGDDGHQTADVRGRIATAAGEIEAHLTMNDNVLKALVETDGFRTETLFEHRFMPTNLSLKLLAEAHRGRNGMLHKAHAKMHIPTTKMAGTEYRDIAATIDYAEGVLKAQLESRNSGAEADIALQALLDEQRPWGRLPEGLTVKMEARDIKPKLLHLTDRYGDGTFSFSAEADIEHPASADGLQAWLNISDFKLEGDAAEEAPFSCKKLTLQARPSDKGHHLTLRSDFADLEYEGTLKVKSLKELGFQALAHTLPDDSAKTLMPQAEGKSAAFVLAVKDTEILRRLAGINIWQEGTIQAHGNIGVGGNDFALSLIAPKISIGKMTLEQATLFAQNNGEGFDLLGKCGKRSAKSRLTTEVRMKRDEDGRILTDVEWMETMNRKFNGHVSAATRFSIRKAADPGIRQRDYSIHTEFMPTRMCLNDSIWDLKHSWVNVDNGVVSINNFGLYSGRQNLTVNGIYDRHSTDPIVLDLKNVDLEYILAIARLDVVEFSGHATGRALVRQLEDGSPWAQATVNVPDLCFNHAALGNGNITIGWDHPERDITIDGDIREPGQGFTIVKGYVDPVNRNLDLRTESLNTQLGFINKYTEGIFENVSGRASGHCRIYGGFKTICFEGKERGSAEATIPVTGVSYRIEGADIDIKPDAFIFRKAQLRDFGNGTGNITGRLEHEHIKNMRYDFRIDGEGLHLYNKPRELDMPFFATAKGSGNVHLYGSPGKMNADMTIRTIGGSELTYILDSPDADVSQLLSIHPADEEGTPHDEGAQKTMKGEQPTTDSKTDIDLYFQVDVDPQSCLHLITDDKSGDAITVYGQGPIQANYHNKSGFKMFGTYNIERGTYGLNIPMLAQRKQFDILPGGQVNFYGDPTQAEVKVKARYVVNSASLADLNIGSGFANHTTRVDCLVDIYGEVANMQFDLDFDLPNVSDDEKQMVRNLIASDEERTMQVLYLLGVGRFYAYNLGNAENGQSQSTLMMNSLLSSTLSSQLNSIISNAIGRSNWSFGTNISTGQMGWNDTEVEGLISSRLLNNRLVINGNFGYSNRQAATTNFVGDFDVQYLITPQGTVSIRAYSETNDRYFTKSTLTTQGVGLQLKRDFTRLKDLFTIRKKKKQAKK